ncbi:proteasome subunit alpha type-1-like [Trichogramma pretiosum]|uniref:proteasome subunit alpha type-1-like n=1 Tax=Trichogramma pretiosum TaxID=7493 RepID=UPI0006C9B833|nr:proteasome subunit alpha type-1-like [Trichogramma pretiosum]
MIRSQPDWKPIALDHERPVKRPRTEPSILASLAVGLKNQTHAVVVTLDEANSDSLPYGVKKIIPIATHIGMATSGVTADASTISQDMRRECLHYQLNRHSKIPVTTLIESITSKMDACARWDTKRPYGIGSLVAGYDDQGPHLFETCPSAGCSDGRAMATGEESRDARTYLEKHLDEFASCKVEDLVRHGLRSARDTLPSVVHLSTKNISIGIVGKDTDFRILDDAETQRYLVEV